MNHRSGQQQPGFSGGIISARQQQQQWCEVRRSSRTIPTCIYDLLPRGEWVVNNKKTTELAKGNNTSHIDGRSRMDVCLGAISRVLDVDGNPPAQRGQPKSNTMRKSHPMQKSHPNRTSNLTRESNPMPQKSNFMPRKLNPARVKIQNNMVFGAGGNRPIQCAKSKPMLRKSILMGVDIQNNNTSTNWRGSDAKCPPPASDLVRSASSGIVGFLGTDPLWTPGLATSDSEWLELGDEKNSKTWRESNAKVNGSTYRRGSGAEGEGSTSGRGSEQQVWSPGLDPVWSPRLDLGDCWVDNGVAQTVVGEINWPRTRGSRLSKWTLGN